MNESDEPGNHPRHAAGGHMTPGNSTNPTAHTDRHGPRSASEGRGGHGHLGQYRQSGQHWTPGQHRSVSPTQEGQAPLGSSQLGPAHGPQSRGGAPSGTFYQGTDQWATSQLSGSVDGGTDWFAALEREFEPDAGYSGNTGQQTWVDPSVAQARPAVQSSAVGLLDRPDNGSDTRNLTPVADAGTTGGLATGLDHPSIPPGTLEITPQDVYDVLGPDADDVLATAEVDVDEIIRRINDETTVLPPLEIPTIPDDPAEAEPAAQPSSEVVEEAVTTWKRRFVRGAVAAVLVSLAGSGGAAAAMDKSVDVNVDGQQLAVNTFDSTVGEVLEDEGIHVGKHDVLNKSPQASVGQGDTITLDRGRLMTVNVDGQQRQEWVHSGNVGQALQQMGVSTQDAKVSTDLSKPVPKDGMELNVQTQKNVTVIDGGGQPRQLTTHAVNVDELLNEQNMQLGPQDEVSTDNGKKLTDGAEVRIERTGSTVSPERQSIDPPVKEIVDNSMLKGEEHVEKPGKPGEKIVFTRITTHNGDETGREVVNEEVKQQPQPRVMRVGGKEPPNSGVWDKLVQCESGGDWQTSTGNGYYGGLQFDKSTWDAYGGDQYAEYPHQASREQQISIAEKMRDERGGYGAWPSCAAQAGLT